GSLYKNRRYDNHKEDLYRYVVRRREDLIKVIIPFFDRHTLQTSKKDNFILFARCLEEISKGEHLKREGMIKILQMTQKMNHKRDRTDLIKILRNQTSAPL